MACITIVAPPLPPVPLGLTLPLPALPGLPGLPNFCCKLPPLERFIKLPPIPLPGPLKMNPAFLVTLNTYITAINSYLKAIPLKCPTQ